MPVSPIDWDDGTIRLLDQTLLPEETVWLNIKDIHELAEAIKMLRVRGAPAIGIAAALGVAMAANNFKDHDITSFYDHLDTVIDTLARTRPTAVNLFWALDRMRTVLSEVSVKTVEEHCQRLLAQALAIQADDRATCRIMGKYGAALLSDSPTVLTHCNAGGLATGDYGTALGVFYAAQEMGKTIRVYADETRPLLQGSRLTAWELMQANIDVVVLPDSAAGMLLASGRIEAVFTGADRIAGNGDVANKIGTYPLAVLAKRHQVPFYVVAPVSTFDLSLASGEAIPIEERHGDEVVNGFGRRTGPKGVKVFNPAFDVSPAELITAIITEHGVIRPPFTPGLAAAAERSLWKQVDDGLP
ncbi:S-methyl-5-thioribose-1-phosphate isomerase [bacterium]|nr:S-methyl-5-thioribose-1-phosphate isomerase [bacterium]